MEIVNPELAQIHAIPGNPTRLRVEEARHQAEQSRFSRPRGARDSEGPQRCDPRHPFSGIPGSGDELDHFSDRRDHAPASLPVDIVSLHFRHIVHRSARFSWISGCHFSPCLSFQTAVRGHGVRLAWDSLPSPCGAAHSGAPARGLSGLDDSAWPISSEDSSQQLVVRISPARKTSQT